MTRPTKTLSPLNDIQTLIKLVEASGAFDANYYAQQLKTTGKKATNLIKHYLLKGWKLGLDPHPCFDTAYYIEKNKDIEASKLHPFVHFILFGHKEARHTKSDFFLPNYKSKYPEIQRSGINPLKHFTQISSNESKVNNQQQRPVALKQGNQTEIDLGMESNEIRPSSSDIKSHFNIIAKSSLFDIDFYVSHYKDMAHCESPLEHYVLFGGIEGRAASKLFDSQAYLDNNPDVTESGINPLVHYELFGKDEGRSTYRFIEDEKLTDDLASLKSTHLFDADYYLQKYPDVAESTYTPWQHFLLIGGQEGREASKYFNCKSYLEAYEDVKSSGMNPLIHYLSFGIKEKRVAFESELEIASFLKASRSKTTVILDNLPNPIRNDYRSFRCALLIHVFYFDVFLEIFNLSQGLPFSKLIVTTTPANFDKVNKFLKENCKINFRVTVIHINRGRDIAPFLNENVDNLFDFDLVCKVHTKKSPHLDTFGNRWKKHLIENLIGSRSVFDKIFALFHTNPKLGIAYPEPMEGTNNSDWAANKSLGISIFDRLGLSVSEEELEKLSYPPATMFWFRPQAIKQVFHSYAYSDFPDEPIHFDGTVAHALERTLNYVCKHNSYEVLEYITFSGITNRDYKEAVIFDWLEDRSAEKFIVVSHEATNTGAPKTALSILRALRREGKSCLTILLTGGDQEDLFDAYGPVINYKGQPLRESLLRILLENHDIKVICNTVVSYQAAAFFSSIGLPVISLVHEFFSSGHFSEEMFSTVLQRSDKVIYPAQLVLNDTLDNIDYKPKNISLMPQGIYDDSFPMGDPQASRSELICQLGIPKDSIIVLCCGTVEARKGFDLLIETAKHVLSKNAKNEVHFVWVGKATENDPYYIKCMSDINSNKVLRSHIHLVGAHSRVDRFFLAADIFALTSRFDPFPGVVLEAMAANMPVVCFEKTTGVHEAFLPGVGGYVAKHLDPMDMANKILSLCKNMQLARLMGERNAKRVRAEYNFGAYTNKLLTSFSEIENGYNDEQKFSIIVPVFNTPPNYLQKMIQSVLNQSYTNWELCIADGSTLSLTQNLINYYSAVDDRIKSIKVSENKGIAENTNIALNIATGDYLCFLDHDDTLEKNALKEVYDCISRCDPDVIYTDEDKVDEHGLNFFAPVIKPTFNYELLQKYNYVTHFLSIRSKFFFEKIISVRSKYDGAQDYDTVLRCAEHTDKIEHIPKILYHWRVFESSTAKGTSSSKTYAIEAGRLALEDHFARSGRKAQVTLDERDFRYLVS